MGQILVRNLDDSLLADYREAAAQNGRSLEAEVRAVLTEVRPKRLLSKDQMLAKLAEIRAMTPTGVTQTPAEQLVREDRDGDRS